MLVLVTYDVCTSDPGGTKRLRQVAQKCLDYGQRVQNSVFECNVNMAEYKMLQHSLEKLIDLEKDSLRFYNIGKTYESKIKHIGCKSSYNPEGFLSV